MRLLRSLCLICVISVAMAAMAAEDAGPASRPASSATTSAAKVYDAWPFDANEARRRQEETAKDLGLSTKMSLDLGNEVTMDFVLIPAGKFVMGSPKEEEAHHANETQHEVTISKPFYMGAGHVTRGQYKQLMGNDPSAGDGAQGPNCPIYDVTWNDAAEFCKKLSAKTGKAIRLPTEARWEYACRAGTATPFYTGATISSAQANYNCKDVYGEGRKGEYLGKTTPAGTYAPNAFGLYDMHGNLQQWCADLYDPDYYAHSPKTDPLGPSTGQQRVLRGGCGGSVPAYIRSAFRWGISPEERAGNFGFRVVCVDAADPEPFPVTVVAAPPAAKTAWEVYKPWPFDANEAVRRQEETAKALGVAKETTLSLGDELAMKMVLVPAGRFWMGSPNDEYHRERWEGPQHEVVISKPFHMGTYTVTQAQYEQVMGKNPSAWQGASNPVEHVTWSDAMEFCNRVSQKTGLTVRLPTEAEWEYACRAGTKTPFYTGETINTDQANFDGREVYADNKKGQYRRDTTPVGTFKPNAFGLYDMLGNVQQWCSDWYDRDYYAKSPDTDPQGPEVSKDRVLRGGSWIQGPWRSRSANRDWNLPDYLSGALGFRVVYTAQKPAQADDKVAELIRQLGDAKFNVREDATKKLTAMGASVYPALKTKLEEEKLDPEIAARIKTILGLPIAPAQGGKVVTDDETEITVSLGSGGELTATRAGKIVWKTSVGKDATSLKVSDGRLVVSPGGAVLDVATGKLLEKPK